MSATVMIVDDNPNNLMVLEEILSADGYNVRAATSGEIALKVIPLIHPDLILLDIMMPGLNGFDVCRQLHNDPSTADIPVLFISALSDTAEKLKGFEAGGLDYITKPFAGREVLARVRTHLDLYRFQKNLQAEVAKAVGEKEKAYQEIQALNSSLEQKVADGVEELRRKDQLLLQQNRHAALGSLLSNIAHQWRQPLNNIALIIQQLELCFKEGVLNTDDLRNDVETVMQIIGDLSHTIDEFRKYYLDSREVKVFRLQPGIRRITDLFAPAMNELGITLRLELVADVAVNGSEGELIQALYNIIQNSMDVIKTRQVKDPAVMIRLSASGDDAVLQLEDNGGGIDNQLLPRIFDPYFSTKFAAPGVGVGLYMTRLIIEQHLHGQINVESDERGVCFTIRIPVADNS